MAVIINASTSTGLVQSADNSGIIQFQSNGSTKATLSSSGFSYTGGVLQVVNATYSTQVSTSSGTFQDTGLSATITPSSSSSKILVIWAINGTYSAAGVGVETNLVRTSTQLVYTENLAARDGAGNDAGSGTSGGTYLDSPATTSATTYKCQFRSRSGASAVYVQHTGSGGASTSMMTLMEIVG